MVPKEAAPEAIPVSSTSSIASAVVGTETVPVVAPQEQVHQRLYVIRTSSQVTIQK
jgi:hypothetical protein